MKTPVSLTIDEPLFEKLYHHLFPGDGDEHGAVIATGIAQTPRGTRLLAREVFLAQDGVDYVPGTRGYRALTAKFVAQVSGYCEAQNLCYLAVHCHGGQDDVCFSADDMASHKRGYPALLDITKGGPVGALVFAANAVAGDIWTRSGRFPLSHLSVIGSRVRKLYPSPQPRPPHADPIYDRHARLFGDLGQNILSNLKVGIIGLGGGGSLLNEWLSRLGVGHIVAIDFDKIELTNHPRIVGSTRWEAMAWLTKSRNPWLQKLGSRLAGYKVHIARRVAKQANPSIRYDAVVGNIVDEPIARLLTDADFIFLASDSIQSRLVFNALVHQYLIPGIQIGAKVSVDKNTKQVGDIFTATRPVLPFANGGCLHCHELIPAARLQEEALSEEERRTQRYVEDDDVAQPSVITLNVQSAAQAVNDFMMMFTGLYQPQVTLCHQMSFVRERRISKVAPRSNDTCLDCSNSPRSRRARGDRLRLPCRIPKC
ncbi:ThiF family adenylyltransferase [Kamptonema animale CS-326]|jgi:tRNA A37 threonylcarbamoyladenosine dehydratase|uniref:ThiF family adenylyltransferase n=1 Tax=Kamptonema animale TaxID=92934 RepID=UPI00232DF8AA|nr:ThiF family adenylyltransferase [Kamptonema animale]MDB9515019.1 ThiF family adenylyltransferase [Kamptonema animale CS-326]